MALSCSKKTLFREITSKNKGDFYCLNCLHSSRRKKLESHKKVCENKDFFGVIMPSEDTKILEFISVYINTGNLIRHHLLSYYLCQS